MDTWSLGWAFRNLVAELFMPPGIWLILNLAGVFLFKKKQILQRIIVAISILMIWMTCTNYFATQINRLADYLLGWPQPLNIEYLQNVEKNRSAIVILGSGRRKGAFDAPRQYQEQDVSSATMERLRLAARLAKATYLPILVSGGAPDKSNTNDLSEAEMMSLVMEHELGVKPKWIDGQANTTKESAKLSARILKKENIQSVYLVTHFWHMPRAKTFFEKEGIHVIQSPVGFYNKKEFTPLDFYPSTDGLQKIRHIIHEILGNLWLRLE